MTTSQSDVDKVMAAFGAAPITYRPNQDAAAGWDPRPTAAKGEAPAVTDRAASSAQSPERILPGAGGRVREIFPLLWRAIPVVGDLKVGATKRPGDEIPDKEPVSVADQMLAARLQAAGAQTPSDAAAPRALADGPVPPTAPEAEGDPAVDQQSPAQWARQEHEAAPAAPPAPAPAPVAAVQPRPPQPLRSHADMIRPVGPKDPRPAPSALPPEPQLLPQAQLPPPPAYQPPPQAAAYPQSPQGYQPPPAYPPYYPPPAMPSYPAYPGAAGWPQPAYPQPYAQPYPPAPYTPPPYTPPPYPQMGGGYPPAYPPGYPPAYQPAYPAVIPYGYPPPAAYAPAFPPAYGAPPPHPQQSPPPPPAGAPQPQPQPAAGTSSPASLSDIFAALHRGRSKDRGQETPQ